MKQHILNTLHNHFRAKIEMHRVNIEVMLENPVAIPEHTDYVVALEKEISHIAEYMDKLEVLNTYFKE